MVSVERERAQSFGRLEEGLSGASEWYEWGPYLSERAWGTVREDYSPGGTAWDYLPHDHARSKAYRWNEDGLAGLSDIHHRLCFALALWNGRDPVLKERPFGLTGPEGNHGEDVKEYWWYLDALPSSAWLQWRYHYPQRAYPYEQLLAETRTRGRLDPEYELLDTGVFAEDRYWRIDVDYAKADPVDIAIRIRVTNAGPDADSLHVLPTLWFRNDWSWDFDVPRPLIELETHDLRAEHAQLGTYRLSAAPTVGHPAPEALFCDNDTNMRRLYGVDGPPFPKDGINDHVVHGAATVNPAAVGTKAAWHYVLNVPAGQTVELRLRLRRDSGEGLRRGDWPGSDFDAVFAQREAEANEFYAELTPADASDEEARVMRQAFAGMLWGKQFYSYDVARWLSGDPTQPRPPDSRRYGRNAHWGQLNAFDVLSMPDPWEYPWFAAWDLAFHAVTLAHIDPAFAKYQLAVLCREWFLHPNGALPAYEWAFDDVNPPVHAWAALKVYLIDGSRDREFLEKVFHKLLLNFTWWVNRQDAEGNSLFEGGFLGLDNVGPLDRSHLPPTVRLEQADGTAWMASYCLAMLRIALELAADNPTYEPLATKFFEHFALITDAVNSLGLWDASDGFFYDQLVTQGRRQPVRVRSIVGILPILAAIALPAEEVAGLRDVRKQFAGFLARRGQDESASRVAADPSLLGAVQPAAKAGTLLSLVTLDQLRGILAELLDEQSFLSPYGLRSLSRRHRELPVTLDLDGLHASVGYEPAESTTGMFGGNSNWRGPVWFPVNYLVIEALGRFSHYLGDSLTVEFPTGSGRQATLAEVAADLRRRLISLFLVGPDGRRPANGWVAKLQDDPAWREGALFYEYFSGDNGAGLGASHQTGWTGLVADLITGRRLPGLA